MHTPLRIIISSLLLVSAPSVAAWYDSNAVGTAPDWSYRVPIDLPATTKEDQTVKLDVDFNALLSSLGVSGTFDSNSPRIVRPNGSLASQQEFTDIIYNDVIDTVNNAKGQVKFIVNDDGVGPYYLYFDTTANGSKPANNQPTINGNFEHSSGSNPSYWTATASNTGGAEDNDTQTTSYGQTFSSSLRCSDGAISNSNVSPNNALSAASTTGQKWHLLGYRNSCEDGTGSEYVKLQKQFTVPSSNEGNFEFYFQMQGFDSYSYDKIEIRVNNTLIDHTSLGITNSALQVSNNFIGLKETYSSTIKDSNWQKAQIDLSSYRGQDITVEIAMRHASDNVYRTWVKIDDAVWSLQSATLGTPEIYTPIEPKISVLKTQETLWDPVNGASLPKAIPGAIVEYTLKPINSGTGAADNNSITLVDAIPTRTALVVSDIGTTGSGPVSFIDGTPSSGLSYNFVSLSSAIDNVAFSSDGGASFSHTPSPDGNGVDSSVTHIQVMTQGIFQAATTAGNPSFEMRFRVQVQ